MSDLSPVEWKALYAIADKQLKASTEKIEAGGYNVEFSCDVSAVVTKEPDSDAAAKFDAQPVLLQWLNYLLASHPDRVTLLKKLSTGKLGAGHTSDLAVSAAISNAVEHCKEDYHRAMPRTPRAGSTKVAGTITKRSEGKP